MQIAQTVRSIANPSHPLVAQIMNRELPLSKALCQQVMSQTQLSYHGRNPKPAVLCDGQVRKTNLDLLSLLADLYKRSARVVITSYDNRLPWQAVADEHHVGGTKRFGHITGLISHQQHLSFSLRVRDESVYKSADGTPTIGVDRSYMLADYTGAWHQGWSGFSWDMTKAEREYCERRKILVNGTVDYEDYIHLNRRQSVLGAPYLLLKLLHQRIEDEISFFEREVKRLRLAGVDCPADLQPATRLVLAEGASQSVAVPVFTMSLAGLSYTGEYTPVSTDVLGYRLAMKSIRFLSGVLRPTVQFMMRADEVAFYRFGLAQDYLPRWINGTRWQHSGAYAAWIELGETLRLSYQTGTIEKKVAA